MKILILRFSSIGDIVLTTPVMRCIKTQRPEHEIHYATKKQFGNLLMNNPYIDKLHLLEDSMSDLISKLKQEQFDLILDLHNNLRTVNIRTMLRIKRHKLDKLNWEKWLMVKLKINLLPYRHIVDRYLDTAEELGIVNDGKGLDYFISKDTQIDHLNLPESYCVYALGGQHNTKKLPPAKQIELLNSIPEKVVLIGGKEDMEAGKNLAASVSNAINLCGSLSIDQSALVMQNSIKVYSHDTGMMHIAAALKKPIVSIWGNTIPEFGMYPYYPAGFDENHNDILEVPDLSCRPCSKLGYERCPKGHFNCMNLQVFSEK
ncbi:MAG TPA: glycosyltransferase family 9 protein [Bacteroidia bacterium]